VKGEYYAPRHPIIDPSHELISPADTEAAAPGSGIAWKIVPVEVHRPRAYTRNAYESMAWTRAVYRRLAPADAMDSAEAGRPHL